MSKCGYGRRACIEYKASLQFFTELIFIGRVSYRISSGGEMLCVESLV